MDGKTWQKHISSSSNRWLFEKEIFRYWEEAMPPMATLLKVTENQSIWIILIKWRHQDAGTLSLREKNEFHHCIEQLERVDCPFFSFLFFSDTEQRRLYLTPPHHPHLSPGLTATSTAHPLLPSGPPALEPHKGALTREKKEPVPLGRDYIPVRFFSPLGRPPLNPPLPWLESEQGKAGWVQKKAPYMCDEVLHCCMK